MQPPRPNIRSSQCSHHAQIWRHISYIMFMSSWPHIRSSQCTLWQIRAFSHNVHWQLLIWGHDDMNMMSEAPYMPIYSMGTKGRGHRQIDISIYGHKRVMMVHTAAAQQQFEPTSSQRTIITYLHIWRLLRTASPLFNHIFIWLFLTNVHDNISPSVCSIDVIAFGGSQFTQRCWWQHVRQLSGILLVITVQQAPFGVQFLSSAITAQIGYVISP